MLTGFNLLSQRRAQQLRNTLSVTIPVNLISCMLDINIQVHLLSQRGTFPLPFAAVFSSAFQVIHRSVDTRSL